MKNANTISLRRLREKYAAGANIMAYLREKLGVLANTPEIVLQSYDLQAGSYVKGFLTSPEDAPGKIYRREVARRIAEFPATTVLEAGVGEATCLYYSAKEKAQGRQYFGFDISWSRLAVAKAFLASKGLPDVQLATGDLFSIPLPDNSIDLVYTSHSIEPNGGREVEALQELWRITRRWLILFEPSSELGNEETRRRIDAHGYCKDLSHHARAMGFSIIEHRLLDSPARPENQTAMIVMEKKTETDNVGDANWACPVCQNELTVLKGQYFCSECLKVYPRIDSIPCLLQGNGIVATRFEDSHEDLLPRL